MSIKNSTNPNEFILTKLRDAKITLSTCEVITGGMISSQLNSISWAKEVFVGGLVINDKKIIETQLKVKEKTIQDNTLVSGEVADEMAIGCSHFFNTDCAISLTDVHDGIVYVGIKIIDIVKHYKITTLSNERNAMRAEICADALIKLYSLLKDM